MTHLRFWLRLICLVPLRFLAILLLAFFAQNFEVTPFPTWTLAIFVYLMLLLLTYSFTRWSLRGCALTRIQTLAVGVGFLVIGTMLELGFGSFFSGLRLGEHLSRLSWKDFAPVLIHALAFTLAVLRLKQKRQAVI